MNRIFFWEIWNVYIEIQLKSKLEIRGGVGREGREEIIESGSKAQEQGKDTIVSGVVRGNIVLVPTKRLSHISFSYYHSTIFFFPFIGLPFMGGRGYYVLYK